MLFHKQPPCRVPTSLEQPCSLEACLKLEKLPYQSSLQVPKPLGLLMVGGFQTGGLGAPGRFEFQPICEEAGHACGRQDLLKSVLCHHTRTKAG